MIITGTRIQNAAMSAVSVNEDNYFNLVSLLLPGNGTNGAQNNTFVDGSTNNLTVTRTGTTTQGTFSPFSQTGWSGYFDGNGDFLNFTKQTTTGSFTCECWFWRGDNVSGYHIVFGGADTTVGADNIQLYVTNTGAVAAVLGGSATIAATGTAVIQYQWNHIAWVRSGTSVAIFVNGQRIATGTSSAALNIDRIASLGGAGVTGVYQARGYISNARITTSAVYDPAQTSFTVPTTPLTNIANTYLLTCQSNRIVDNSSNALAITVNGNTSVQPFSPFAPTADYDVSTVGGSSYFDASGYLQVPAGSYWNFGTGAFTFEMWIYPDGNSSSYELFSINQAGSNQWSWSVTTGNNWGIYWYWGNHGANQTERYTSQYPITGQWNYIVVSRDSGSTWRFYLNGTSLSSYIFQQNTTWSDSRSFDNTSITPRVGGSFTGYMADVRITKGTALYTGSTMSLPTVPLTPVSNTQLMLNSTNSGITDATAKNDLVTVGNARISTAQSKFGGSSMYFDGNGDYLSLAETIILNFGSSDFTIEGWIYPVTTVGANRPIWSTGTNSSNWMSLYLHTTAGRPEFAIISGGSTIIDLFPSDVVSTNAWYHIAVTRSSSTFRMFLNGTLISSGTSSTAVPDYTDSYRVGYGRWNGDTGVYDGYINDLRITRGVARYTTTFTPPTKAFPLS